jgi:hypothetical protein
MAVTAVLTRTNASFDSTNYQEFCTAALTGTYATGGFTFNPYTIYSAAKGSTPLPSANLLRAIWTSPLGYIYYTTVSGNVATTKILSAPGTELANTTAVPDASVPVILIKRKL